MIIPSHTFHSNSPATFRYHHFRAQLVELLPQVLALQRHLRVIHHAVILGLHLAQGPHCRVQLMGHRGQHHVFRGRVGRAQRMVVRIVWVVELGQQAPGVEMRVRASRGSGEGGQGGGREIRCCRVVMLSSSSSSGCGRSGVGSRYVLTLLCGGCSGGRVRAGQQGGDAEVGSGQLQEWMVGHSSPGVGLRPTEVVRLNGFRYVVSHYNISGRIRTFVFLLFELLHNLQFTSTEIIHLHFLFYTFIWYIYFLVCLLFWHCTSMPHWMHWINYYWVYFLPFNSQIDTLVGLILGN